MEPALQPRKTDVRVLVTREVRWFFTGDIPDGIWQWFTAGDARFEHRLDVYDFELARLGVGAKRRSSGSVDTKYLLSSEPDVDLGGGIRGRVEDWVKVSAPTPATGAMLEPRFLPIDKVIRTRRCLTDPLSGNGSASPSGCDIELVTIRSGEVEGWSLCLETVGPRELRGDGFAVGVDVLVEALAPRERSLLTVDRSLGYPAWIARSFASSPTEAADGAAQRHATSHHSSGHAATG